MGKPGRHPAERRGPPKVVQLMMSGDNNQAATKKSCCASCGIAEDDDTKLKKCTACYLVQYCGSECQKEHRPKHKRDCKKRAAELRDELLFKQPESTHMGDCPICCLPLPLGPKQTGQWACCSKQICIGCIHANREREREQRQDPRCPFCRERMPKTEAEYDRNKMKRVEANDPVALRSLGVQRREEGDYKSAFEYWTKAVEFGSVGAHYDLACMYAWGCGAKKDEKKEVYHLEQAAIGGHLEARHNLGGFELENGRRERAIKHFIIAANFGSIESVKTLRSMYQNGIISKNVFASAFRAYQDAVDATKSPQRELAERDMANRRG